MHWDGILATSHSVYPVSCILSMAEDARIHDQLAMPWSRSLEGLGGMKAREALDDRPVFKDEMVHVVDHLIMSSDSFLVKLSWSWNQLHYFLAWTRQ